MELTKSQLLTAQQALGYAVMYAKTEHETAEFALLKLDIDGAIIHQKEVEKQKVEHDKMGCPDLLNEIRNVQMSSGEEAVIASLKEKGLLLKESESDNSQKFFLMFIQIRKELCEASPTETFYLEEAIRKTFDSWKVGSSHFI